MELAIIIAAIANALIKGGEAASRIVQAWQQNAEMTPEQTAAYDAYRKGVYGSAANKTDAEVGR